MQVAGGGGIRVWWVVVSDGRGMSLGWYVARVIWLGLNLRGWKYSLRAVLEPEDGFYH